MSLDIEKFRSLCEQAESAACKASVIADEARTNMARFRASELQDPHERAEAVENVLRAIGLLHVALSALLDAVRLEV